MPASSEALHLCALLWQKGARLLASAVLLPIAALAAKKLCLQRATFRDVPKTGRLRGLSRLIGSADTGARKPLLLPCSAPVELVEASERQRGIDIARLSRQASICCQHSAVPNAFGLKYLELVCRASNLENLLTTNA